MPERITEKGERVLSQLNQRNWGNRSDSDNALMAILNAVVYERAEEAIHVLISFDSIKGITYIQNLTCQDAHDPRWLQIVSDEHKAAIRRGYISTNNDASLSQNGFYSPKELATFYNLSHDALRKRLERHRSKDSSCFSEIQNPASGQSKFVYRLSAIKLILEEMSNP